MQPAPQPSQRTVVVRDPLALPLPLVGYRYRGGLLGWLWRARSDARCVRSPCVLYESTRTSSGRGQFNHTMVRVKDPEVSLKFYTEVRMHYYFHEYR